MFERFDERAYKAVVLAGVEARDRRFSHVGTESLLVGLLLEAETRAENRPGTSSALVERVRAAVAQRVGSYDEPEPESRVIELTPRARQVLGRAGHEAAQEGAARVAPRHILLAASRVGEGEGLNALRAVHVSADDLSSRLYG
jgi:ATP-dependent Clp protease ATP-binding subunit ClpA